MTRFPPQSIDFFWFSDGMSLYQDDNTKIHQAQIAKEWFRHYFHTWISKNTLTSLRILKMCWGRLYTGVPLSHHQYNIWDIIDIMKCWKETLWQCMNLLKWCCNQSKNLTNEILDFYLLDKKYFFWGGGAGSVEMMCFVPKKKNDHALVWYLHLE